MEEEEYCDICGIKQFTGNILLPCTHKLCDGCKGEGKFEKCPRCDTKNVKMIHINELIENENFEDGQAILRFFKKILEYDMNQESELIKRRIETEDCFKNELQDLKRKMDEHIANIDISIERKRTDVDITNSRIELLNRIFKKGKGPNKHLLENITVFRKRKIHEFSEPRIIIGSRGKDYGKFDYPHDVTSNSKGQILVCDTKNDRIQIFELDGTFIKSFGSRGSDPGQFKNPTGIAIDHQDNIYVSDCDNNRIQIFNDDGSKIIKIIGRDDCGVGKQDGEFYWPMGICINPQNRDILVSDSWNNRIQIFDKDFNFIKKFGYKGRGKGELDNPIGIVINSKNEILVSEYLNYRIQIFDYEGNHLKFIGDQNRELKNPYYLCIDEMDNIYVGSGEDGFPLQIFDADGKLIKSFKIKENGKLVGVDIHSIDGSLMVTDDQNNVVYIY